MLGGEIGKGWDVLVTGCGGSGTTYCARLLRQNGLAVTHDAFPGKQGVVTNACDGEFVYVYPYDHRGREYVVCQLNVREFRNVVHVVRNPLRAISSVLKKWQSNNRVWPLVRDSYNIKIIDVRSAALYWVLHNERIEEVSDYRFQVENVTLDPKSMLLALGSRSNQRLDTRPGQSGKKKAITWEELEAVDAALAWQVKEQARRYGYST